MTARRPARPADASRTPTDLEGVLARVDTPPFCTGRYGRGVLAGLRWALGHQVAAPITEMSLPGVPGPARLQAEADAARAELLGHHGRSVQLDYARGVYEALAWVCGHRQHPPETPAYE
ncbi:hypothetical protein [Kitasatospora sp. A2-31]|uniref:hypothetical protein n=1 Tax=Kitasatospora sp. A2-31 TaxID=2916414 RepID=UPI001EEC189C|nr:hypothetical protein [Kitasatospora sp. A2-31]MCG6494317.1 hypothetical protein [Kitasatospora sp. A2-31]